MNIENEYGARPSCDKNYREWLRDETSKYVRNRAVIFTNDGPNIVHCGKIDGVLAALDFAVSGNMTKHWNKLKKVQPKGPLVNSEYYPGWLTHWQERNMYRVPFEWMKKNLMLVTFALFGSYLILITFQ